MIVEIVFVFVVSFYLATLVFNKRKQNLPPGPWEIPFIGRIPHIRLESCEKDRQKYGDIFMRRFGKTNFLYITDYSLSKELFNTIELSDRPHWEFLRLFESEKQRGTPNGVAMNNGENWQHNRRFLLQNLRDLGMGKSKLEGLILREVEILVEDFKTLTESPSKLPFSINICVLNVIWQLVASRRYELHDEGVFDFMNTIHDTQNSFGAIGVLEQFPMAKNVLPDALLRLIFKFDKLEKTAKKFEKLVQDVIDDHEKQFDPVSPKDVIDEYLIELKSKDENKKYPHFCNSDLIRITLDLFVAGNETTSSMIHWVLIYMANFRTIQTKMQNIIDEFVPRGTLPGLEHRENLCYLDAIINEVSRHCCFITLGLFRCTNTDITIRGYHIPKGTVVNSCPGVNHRDPAYWNDPDVFDPSRFIDDNGKFSHNHEGYQPFGIGKRQCLGEQFARMELYLFLAALLQNFTFAPAEGQTLDTTPRKLPTFNMPNQELVFSIKKR